MSDYQALSLIKQGDQVQPEYISKELPKLQDGHVLIRVQYSSINRKDALMLDPNSGVVHDYPIIPGIDFSGMVIKSKDPRFFVGDKVVGTGFDFGIKHPGGYAEFITASADQVFKIPRPLTMRDAMILGTAGLTAAISLSQFLQIRQTIDKTIPILVTGVTGGVGGLTLAMLHKLGFKNITAVTRRTDVNDYLVNLGASTILTPTDLANPQAKPLLKGKYMAILDSVGGQLLGDLLGQVQYGGRVITSGNAAGNDFKANVLPFILRSISLIGVDSVNYPAQDRQELWQLLSSAFRLDGEHSVAVHEIAFEDMVPHLKAFMSGSNLGRTIVAFP
ncbi:zinc-containing alcohol dehydrogenase (oxidoreductase) [Agrilactobacillus composti DSM 18527 = JCM 14202]|uniref:Zinc-containing alcohol dehydrogenase (Oxidoreductase) n=1 Tax=Agrilactobacillus composti DSM 18527 = JCM 14202 TaxID=1423734 RepID=X0PEN4_9LACO|nr:acryloyl-CoA reductase [Agrilactobacillus composti]KRM35162.1 zinc-containing alcohol dehydrogenase (oxidoreductase) [Agrilactobacillus composti DSM 18527 = JCM 14202]GAF40209.1 alcohol dehydrogenase [Agrilactobacillus composti DSM 18527 = JCM 14202]